MQIDNINDQINSVDNYDNNNNNKWYDTKNQNSINIREVIEIFNKIIISKNK
jgi:hypothetical protein